MSWLYDFWLSVFHIITSRSALGVKELIVQFHRLLIVSEEKNDLQLPEDFIVPFPLFDQKVKLCVKLGVTGPFLLCCLEERLKKNKNKTRLVQIHCRSN